MIKISNGYKSFKDTIVFKNLNLVIQNPGLYMVKGESGSGKSTLLNLLAGYEAFDQGNIHIDENVATIFQNYELIEELTVKENIFLTNYDITDEDNKIIETLRLSELMNHYCNELSGGQKQRVGIARALILQPNIILCDEPTESLDIKNKFVVMDLLKMIAETKIVIVVSHDQQIIDMYGDVVYSIENYALKLNKSKTVSKKLVINSKKRFDKTHFNKLIHKLLWKKTLVYSLLITCLILLSQMLFVFQMSLFYQSNTSNVVNADVVYINVISSTRDWKLLEINADKLLPLITFSNVEIDDKKMLSNIYPYEKNELEIIGKEPQRNEILINQNVASTIPDWQNKTLELVYIMNNERIVEEFVICGVVNEIDTDSYNFYYNYNEFMNDFKMIPSTTENYNSLYDELCDTSRKYKLNIPYEEMEEFYSYYDIDRQIITHNGLTDEDEVFTVNKMISINNPLYEERLDFVKESAVYRYLFIIFEIIVVMFVVILIFIYVSTDVKKYMSICSILTSMLIPIKKARNVYLKNKIVYMCLIHMIFELLFSIFIYFNWLDYINASDCYTMIAIPIAMITIYISMLIIKMKGFKHENISILLKERKDL